MKWFVSSDIHGFYDEWMDALDEAGFDIDTKEHHIILCGDLLDRGPQPRECLEFVNSLIEQDRIICIMGNHEILMRDLLKNKLPAEYDYHNGTKQSVDDLIKGGSFQDKCYSLLVDADWHDYFNHCQWYYETEHYIFVHSYVPYDRNHFTPLENWRDISSATRSNWEDFATWVNPFLMWAKNGNTYLDGKTLVCGHWNASYAHCHFGNCDKEFLNKYETMWIDSEGIQHPTVSHDTFYGEGIIGLDACTVISHQVNVLVLEDL